MEARSRGPDGNFRGRSKISRGIWRFFRVHSFGMGDFKQRWILT